MCPWDLNYGAEFDVMVHGDILLELVRSGRIVAVHFGTPCQSMSWGRLPQLRSWTYVKGLPDLGEKQKALTTVGNALAEYTAALCRQLLLHG